MTDTRQHAHALIDRLPETQLSALVGLLETIVDPVAAALRDAPIDDEPETEEEKQAVDEARGWLARRANLHDQRAVFDQEQLVAAAELGKNHLAGMAAALPRDGRDTIQLRAAHALE